MTKQTEIDCGAILDITAVTEWCAQVKHVLQGNTRVSIKAADLQRIDTAGLQALLALILSARQRDISVQWDEPAPALIQAASLAGLKEQLMLG